MPICAITAEYNPFHTGHKYQIDLLKEKYDGIVVIMSGNFTQRGDVALINKWERAKSAVLCGADLVLELPTVYAMNTAERFAFGAISIMHSIGCIDAVSFGSECGNINKLIKAAELIENEPDEIKDKIQSLMSKGEPFAAAREKAYSGIIESEILSMPNNILALEYIRHLIKSKSIIKPVTHKREGAGYNSGTLDTNYASASAVRNAYNDYDAIEKFIPSEAFEIYKNADKHLLSNLDTAVIYHIRKNGAECMKNVLECTEGIENRIYKASRTASTIAEIEDIASSKRTTRAKIRRIALSSLLGINKDMCFEKSEYARILAASKNGTGILATMKKTSQIKTITKIGAYKNNMLDIDITSSDIYALSNTNTKNRCAGADFMQTPYIGGKI